MRIKKSRFKRLFTLLFLLIAIAAAYFVLIKPVAVSAQTSCSDACSSGQKRCSGSGYQTCGNYDSDYCNEWSGVYSCSTGYKCQNGSCVRSCSDACTSGSKRCSGSGYQTCVKGSTGCYVWGSVSGCSTGYKCQNGSCVRSCSDACTSGSKRCSGSGYQTCVKGSTGCYVWGSVSGCSTGYKCQNGSCVRSCSDACTSGSKQCSGSGYQTCVKGSSGCYVWGSISNCSTGYACQNGSCVKSCSDACTSGSKRCSGSGYQTCVKGSTGCYVWGSVSGCSTGYKCQNGSCVRSCSDACTSGSKQCSGSGYQTCVKGSSGCYTWGSTTNCNTGYKCQNGSCVRSCSDACSSGSKQCSGSGYQTCVKGSSGCYVWGSISNCSIGYACQNGSCVKSCSDACTSGSKQCSGSGYQTCVKGSSGCYAWGSTTSCSTGYKCQNGSCVRSCSDGCSSGSKQCSGSGYQTCVKGSSGCYVWGSISNCSTGYACQNGSCVSSCSDECTSQDKECSGDAGYRVCGNYDTDKCLEWGTPKNCSTGYVCQNGSCVRSCSDECSDGAKQCSSDSAYQTCAKNSLGCYVWGSSTNCNSGYACQNGSCVSSCSDECSSGEKQCSGSNAYQTCGNYDSDKCLEWGTAKNCSTGYDCQDGSCVRSCSDQCTSGQKQCSDDSSYETCVKTANGCYEWGTPKTCSTGYACQNGSCVSSCLDECTSQDKECSGDAGYRVCGNYDTDKCQEWGTPKNCSNGYVCQNGSCVRSCSDECSDGAKQCSSDSAYQTCAKNSLGCYVWGSSTNCSTGYACQNGSCVSSCSDECTSQDKECSGDAGYRVCGNYDTDKCLEWGTPKNCNFGYTCNNGSCVNTCSDECTSGDKECSGNGYRTCGKYDLDSCYEWSAVTDCTNGYSCQNGSCVKSCSDECSSGDHQCSQTSGRTCGNYDADSCTEWNTYDKCDSQCYACGDGKCNTECGETIASCSKDCGSKKPTVDLTVPASVSCKGSATLTWISTNADSCDASGAWSGNKGTSGSETIDNISTNKTFTLICTGQGGSATDKASVNVETVNPNANAGNDLETDENQDVRLNGTDSTSGSDDGDLTYDWTCDGGSLDNADDAQPIFNTPEVSLDTVYTCTLKVTNNCGKTDTDTANVVVKNKIAGQFRVELSASPDNGCAPLNNVDLTAKIVDMEGNRNDKYTYYFSCNGNGDWDKTITTTATSYTAKDLCDYDTEDDYRPEVKVEGSESGEEATDSTTLKTDDCGKEFTVRLETKPTDGCKPVNDVDLVATVIGNDNNYSGDYIYRFDCDDDGEQDKTVTTSNKNYTAKDLCDYKSIGTHTAKVTVEAGGTEASDTAQVKVKTCGGTEFNVNLTASPDSGCAPLVNVDLTAHITGYDNSKDTEYTYYFDCVDDDNDDWDKTITTTATTYAAKDLCDYDEADSYTARVRVENDGQSDEDLVAINTNDCENGEGDLRVEKTVSNLSRGADYLDSVDARPGDFVSYKIKIEAISDGVQQLTLADILPDGILNPRDIKVNERPAGNNLENGLDLDNLDEGDSITVSFTATVAKASYFSYGQTTITNTATARGKGASDSDTANVVVQRAEVEGITTISTGFTDNPFVDSFVIPLGLALLFVWALKAKLLAIEEWLDLRRLAFAKFHSQKILAAKIARLKIKHITDRFV